MEDEAHHFVRTALADGVTRADEPICIDRQAD
jgi:hypothetical protein